MAETDLLRNVILSMNPCPVCLDAGDQDPMTLDDWMVSDWGIPGSSTRFCEDSCHCVLMPDDIIADFPAIDEQVKLRGEKGTEIRAIVELAPSEASLKEIMDLWNENIGVLPKEIYEMDLYEIEAYLRKLYGEWLTGKR